MKRKTKYKNHKKKGKGKGLTIALLISALLMTGLVTILGLNDWDVGKSSQSVQALLGLSTSEAEVSKKTVENEKTNDDGVKNLQEVGGELEEETEQNPPSKTEPTEKNDTDPIEKPNVTVDAGGYIEGQQLPTEPTYVKNILIANKKNPLPSTFAPGEDKTARAAFEQMAAEAKLSGFNLTAFSTYRSFDYQTTLYERYVARDGKEAADTYSARPGYSEHQTGLAFDIGELNFEEHFASSSFGDTEAGIWLSDNAHRFGFILRYPEGKEEVTGYMHESWHFRYVGIEIATDIFERAITLEEYLGI